MTRNYPKRLLALDVRPRRFGFALFEQPSHLLDSGVARFQSPGRAAVRIEYLIAAARPEALVLRRIAKHSSRDTEGARRVMHAVIRQARRAAVQVSFINGRSVTNIFQQKGAITKHQIAVSLVRMFPELEWKLPTRRRAWEAEAPRMTMFDAVAIGVSYLVSQNHGPRPENSRIIEESSFAGPSVA